MDPGCGCEEGQAENHLTLDMPDWSAGRAIKGEHKEVGIPDWSAGLTTEEDKA